MRRRRQSLQCSRCCSPDPVSKAIGRIAHAGRHLHIGARRAVVHTTIHTAWAGSSGRTCRRMLCVLLLPPLSLLAIAVALPQTCCILLLALSFQRSSGPLAGVGIAPRLLLTRFVGFRTRQSVCFLTTTPTPLRRSERGCCPVPWCGIVRARRENSVIEHSLSCGNSSGPCSGQW